MSDTYTEFGQLNYDANAIKRQGFGMASSGPSDDQKMVRFFQKSERIPSESTSKPLFKNFDFVEIFEPGEANMQRTIRKVRQEDVERWPRQWQLYQRGKEQIPDGTAIDLLFPNNAAVVETLRANHVHTIEQLANLSATGLNTVGMGAQEWVNKAQAWVRQAEKGVDFHKFNKEIAERDAKISTLTRQLEQLSMQVAKLTNPEKHVAPQIGAVPQNFDAQSAQIAALKAEEIHNPQPVNFNSDIGPRKRGRPRKIGASNA